jgi:hypothetical protein
MGWRSAGTLVGRPITCHTQCAGDPGMTAVVVAPRSFCIREDNDEAATALLVPRAGAAVCVLLDRQE